MVGGGFEIKCFAWLMVHCRDVWAGLLCAWVWVVDGGTISQFKPWHYGCFALRLYFNPRWLVMCGSHLYGDGVVMAVVCALSFSIIGLYWRDECPALCGLFFRPLVHLSNTNTLNMANK